MMDAVTVLVLLIIGIVIIKKRFLPRLKNKGQETSQEKDGGTSMTECRQPDFRILCFCTGDFVQADDFAHCVEYDLGNAISDISREGHHLIGDPFPVVIGNVLLIILYYTCDISSKEEVAG